MRYIFLFVVSMGFYSYASTAPKDYTCTVNHSEGYTNFDWDSKSHANQKVKVRGDYYTGFIGAGYSSASRTVPAAISLHIKNEDGKLIAISQSAPFLPGYNLLWQSKEADFFVQIYCNKK